MLEAGSKVLKATEKRELGTTTPAPEPLSKAQPIPEETQSLSTETDKGQTSGATKEAASPPEDSDALTEAKEQKIDASTQKEPREAMLALSEKGEDKDPKKLHGTLTRVLGGKVENLPTEDDIKTLLEKPITPDSKDSKSAQISSPTHLADAVIYIYNEPPGITVGESPKRKLILEKPITPDSKDSKNR